MAVEGGDLEKDSATSLPSSCAPVNVIDGSVVDQSPAAKVAVTPSLKATLTSVGETRRADSMTGTEPTEMPSENVMRETNTLVSSASTMPASEWSAYVPSGTREAPPAGTIPAVRTEVATPAGDVVRRGEPVACATTAPPESRSVRSEADGAARHSVRGCIGAQSRSVERKSMGSVNVTVSVSVPVSYEERWICGGAMSTRGAGGDADEAALGAAAVSVTESPE